MVKEGNGVWVSLEMFIVPDWRSPCMIEGNDIWISVLVLIVRLLTLLGCELIQARGSSEMKKICQKFFLRPKLFFLGGLDGGFCATVRGEGAVMREEVNFKPTVI